MKQIFLTFTMLFMLVGTMLGQRAVTGTVTGSDGETLIGATVLVKGTPRGARTDENGKYTVEAPAGATTLVFSYTGYKTLEAPIGSGATTDVVLDLGTSLEELIVTGSAVGVDKRRIAIDVQTISSKSLPPVATASIDQALVGKIAGAQISSVNGTPGAKTSIVLRGINTINRGTSPMILLDGVEIATDINTIDLNSMDRVEVVQGAAASSIYGAQGANGVIPIP
jgi:TonB-dependent starch-binding outer membrane protein SusC